MFTQQIDLYEQHWLTHINSSIHLPICAPNRVENLVYFNEKVMMLKVLLSCIETLSRLGSPIILS